ARFAEGPVASASNNNGDKVSDLLGSYIADESGVSASARQPIKVTRQDWDLAATILSTTAPSGGAGADWDGVSIYLYQGETITLANWSLGGVVEDVNYILAIDDPGITTGGDQLGTGQDLNWDVTNFDTSTAGNSTGFSISYTVANTGWHYVGTGFTNGVSSGVYETMIEIDGVPYGEFDYTATDGVLSDSAHVTVDARDETLQWDEYRGNYDIVDGTSGDDIIISGDHGDDLNGGDGRDVLIGRAGDDQLTGGADRDLFLFRNASTDGHDIIYDFNIAQGDIINLNALFKALEVDLREILANEINGDTILTIGDGTHTGTQHAGATEFSITLNGLVGLDISQLIIAGNLIVDSTVILPSNAAPEIANPGDQSSAEDDAISLQIITTDPDASDTLSYSAADLPDGLNIDTNTGLISGILSFGSEGTHSVTVTVSDGSTSVDAAFSWTVTGTNQAPAISNPGAQSSAEGAVIQLPITASDADGDSLSYSATGLPDGLSINATTGIISGTLSFGSEGTHSVTVTVNDGSTSVDAAFSWTVTG
ncbi:MAG: type I secretion C-terminal target domain-containing protein, partial [Gammaproteobacteria bacterium]|nr:type I secretion C-terminal target domain-containing protein [Gammaproteobacteria bacterium]